MLECKVHRFFSLPLQNDHLRYAMNMALQFEKYLETYDVSEVLKNLQLKVFWQSGPDDNEFQKPIRCQSPDLFSPPRLAPTNGYHDYTALSRRSSGSDDTTEVFKESEGTLHPPAAQPSPSRLQKLNNYFDDCNTPASETFNFRRARKQYSLPARLFSYADEVESDQRSRRRRRNSHGVKFADEVGEMLTKTMIIPSRFDDPSEPTTSAAADDCGPSSDPSRDENQNDISKGESQVDFPYYLCFDQPSGHMEQLFSRIARQTVCVENVRIDVSLWKQNSSKSYTAKGRIVCRVKTRIDYFRDLTNRRVFARCTNNDWSTYEEVSGCLVDPGCPCLQSFSDFEIVLDDFVRYVAPCLRAQLLPTAPRHKAAVEFAVCYQEGDQTFWDNNDGRNYRIVWP